MIDYENTKKFKENSKKFEIDCIPIGSNSIDDKIYCLRIFLKNSDKDNNYKKTAKEVKEYAEKISKINLQNFNNMTPTTYELPSSCCIGLFEFSSKKVKEEDVINLIKNIKKIFK